MQERNVTDDESMNFAVRRKADSLHSAELFRKIHRLAEAGSMDAAARSALQYRIVCQERTAVSDALEALEAGNNGRFAEIVEEAKEREHSSGQSRALRLQKKLASKAAKSDTGRSVVNSTLGETGSVVLDVILQIVQSLLPADEYADLEVKLYTVIIKTAALNNAECITVEERRTLTSYGLTFCSILIDQCELGSILPYAPEELVESMFAFFAMLEAVVEPFVKADTLAKYTAVQQSFCRNEFFDRLLRTDEFRSQRDRIADALRALRDEIGNY